MQEVLGEKVRYQNHMRHRNRDSFASTRSVRHLQLAEEVIELVVVELGALRSAIACDIW